MNAYNDESILEQNLSSERVFDGLILHIDHLTNRLPNGKTAPREVARHIGASAVLPVDDRGNVLLVRQYSAPIDRVTLEIPAGKLDFKGEDRLAAAKRELREETGASAEKWTHLTDLLSSVGFCDECISVFLAESLSYGDADPDDDEFLNLVRIPFAEALDMVMHNQLRDAKTIASLLMANAIFSARKDGPDAAV